MNRHHLGILFSAIAILLLSSIYLRWLYITEQQQADRTTESSLNFAISSSIGKLNISYGSANDYYTLSDTFFNSIMLMQGKRDILEGRTAIEDYYPYVPVFLCLEERYYHIGSYNGTSYEWSEAQYYPNHALLSDLDTDLALTTIENKINEMLVNYHNDRGLPDTTYILPDYFMRNISAPTILVVLENFPTTLYGHYYSGVFHGGGSLTPIERTP